MRASHSLAIGSAACAPCFPIRIAAGALSPLARRDRRGVLAPAGLVQFRSAAVGAASLIASALRAIGARVQRVFSVLKVVVRRVFHALNLASETERDAPQSRVRGT